MLTQATKTRKSQKQVFILYRCAFKSHGKLNGTVCSQVRTSEGKEHKVWTHSNGCASSCDCEGFEKSHGRKCSHIKTVEAVEVARKAIVIEQTAQALNITTKQVAEIAAIAEQANEQKRDAREQHQAELDAAKTAPNYETESKRRVAAPLNGNRGFQLCPTWAELEAERVAKKAEKQVQEEQEELLPGYFNGCPSVQRREHSKSYNNFSKVVA